MPGKGVVLVLMLMHSLSSSPANPFCAPGQVFEGHLPDQSDGL